MHSTSNDKYINLFFIRLTGYSLFLGRGVVTGLSLDDHPLQFCNAEYLYAVLISLICLHRKSTKRLFQTEDL